MAPALLRIFILFLCLLALPLSGNAQLVKNGVADLTSLNTDSTLRLSGHWEFYWNELLEPPDFNSERPVNYIKVPGSWNRQGHPLLGVATYRIRLLLPANQHSLSLYFPVINCAARAWLNGELIAETGKVSSNSTTYKPQLSATIISIPAKVPKVELIIQVANYSYFSSGVAGTPTLDKASRIVSKTNRDNGIENFFAGSLIAMFIYQVILFFLYQRAKPNLWLALICLGVAVRALIVHGGSFLLPNLFPEVPWEIWKKIEFGSVYAITAFFPLYIYNLFIEYANKKPLWFFNSLALIMCTVVILTPQYFYGQLLDIGHVGLLLAFIYAVYTIHKAWRMGNTDAKVILFGVLSSFPFILAEILQNSMLFSVQIHFMYLVEIGVLVFLLFQVYLLANHYAKAYHYLEQLNLNLEKIVDERTEQLVKTNTVKDKLLSVMSHDVKSPLNSLRGVLQVLNMGAINQDEFLKLTKQIEGDLNKTGMMIENILFWTAAQLKGVKIKPEKFDLYFALEEHVQLFKTIADRKNITLQHNAAHHQYITCDRNILNLLLRNLLANAIKFSFEQGVVQIITEIKSDNLVLQVKDNGIGMNAETLNKIMLPQTTESMSGTGNEKGTGLGLALCREYLQKAGGELRIESTVDKGSTFTVILPLEV
jgi:signal transduction histidine kinase